MSKRSVAVITGTRADYGLLRGTLREIKADPLLNLQLIVTGAHLVEDFGYTVSVIEASEVSIAARVDMLLASDTGVGAAKSLGLGVSGCADAFDRLEPDVVLLLGDRFEMLAAAEAALMMRIPVAHIHGGETTEGAFDESIRHSLTKMAHIHFVTAEPHRARVIQMGEQPDRVFTVGAPGLDQIHHTELLNRQAFEDAIGFQLGDPTFLITLHPSTLGTQEPETSARHLLDAVDGFDGARLIFTKANADPAGRRINERIAEYCEGRDGARLYDSLGQRRYLSALRHVDVVVGNSSSGLIEAPAMDVPTVNVGPRQDGRLRGPSVVDCRADRDAIASAIETVLEPQFLSIVENADPPYGEGRTGQAIAHHLREIDLSDAILKKPFFDLVPGCKRTSSGRNGQPSGLSSTDAEKSDR
jgi:UDP-N-acetylglucosamine 2-epimerase (non-hydrolysing)/GDP/UDP-N,N'-diacetylbacillosamine 2-epimerase (hydrolysing)